MSPARWTPGETPWLEADPQAPPPRSRVLVDNDFAGDPDDFFQLAHHLLSPSVEVRRVIGSHLPVGGPFPPVPDSAALACAKAGELLDVMGLDAPDLVVPGAEQPLADARTPRESAGARAIIDEAGRDDPRPLFVACGGGLTDLASAWLMEPSVAARLTVVWIGGDEYPGPDGPHRTEAMPEFNVVIDPIAAQVVFDSDIPLWQVPRDVYRRCEVSLAELRRRVATQGRLGAWLHEAVMGALHEYVWRRGAGRSEVWCLGDNPLVLLTALQSSFAADSASSDYVVRPAPRLADDGTVVDWRDGRPIRVYSGLDTRLMVEDMVAKFEEFARWEGTHDG
ncbi:nucleoside hydrolase [Blastococcus sp. SYSU D00820]